MHAIVRSDRIDIEGASALPKESWEPMLDELKAVRMPGLTQPGRRFAASIGPRGRNYVSIYRTGLPDEEIFRILAEYGIVAFPEEDMAKGATG
jgi:hypothetical protein